MQRGTTLFVHLLASHLGTVQTARYLHFDTLSAHTHGALDSHLHCTTICNLTLELTSNLVSNDRCIQFRTFNLEDVDLYILLGDFLQFLFQFVNFLSTLSDDITGASGADSYSYKFQSSLYDDTRNTSLCQTGIQVLADLCILKKSISEILTAKPVGIPTTYNTKAVCNWINFLSHFGFYFSVLVFLVSTKIVTWLERLRTRYARP